MNHKKSMLNKEVEYEITDIRVSGSVVLLVLEGKDDAFGVSVPFEQLKNMTEKKLESLLKARVKQRLEWLEEMERRRKANESKLKELEKLKGHKIKLNVA